MSNEQQASQGPETSQEPHTESQHFEIQIDRQHFTVTLRFMTGLQLRHLPTPPIGPDRDLFEVVPGGSDLKIGDEQVVEIRNGLRFFTAPALINPGAESPGGENRLAASQ